MTEAEQFHGMICQECGDDEEDECERGAAGERVPLKLQSPKKPSAEEIATHELTHLPFRSWCPHCVRGKGRSADHRKHQDQPDIDEIHLDYCFLGDADSKVRPIIVAKHRSSRSVMSSVVPAKGALHEFPAKRVRAFLRELGLEFSDVVVRSDQEPSIVDLVSEVARVRAPAKTIPEQSPVGSSQSNGVAERGIQSVEGQVRVLKDALEFRLGVKIPADHDIIAWLVEFASVLLNRYCVSHDGYTAYERLKKKKSRLFGVEFGERVHWRRQKQPRQITKEGKQTSKVAKLDSMWEDGVFLGYRTTSAEMIIGTTSGIMRSRTVRRMPEDERWGASNLDLVKGLPWRPDGQADLQREDDDKMPVVDIRPAAPDVLVERPEPEESVPRQLYVRTKDIQKYGVTDGCPGCRAWALGRKTQTHSARCRERISEALQGSDEGQVRLQAQRARENQYFEQAFRKSEQSRGQKRAGDEPDDSERVTRPEAADRGAKRGAGAEESEDVEKRVRLQGPASSSSRGSASSSTPMSSPTAMTTAGSSSVATPPDPAGAGASQGETEDDKDAQMGDAVMQEINEMRIEMDKIQDMYVTDACRTPEEDVESNAMDGSELNQYWDEKSGKQLDPRKIREAREEEMRALESRVYEVVDVNECWEKTGKAPIGVRWVDVDKGFGVIRSRLVAQDFKKKGKANEREGLFAAMPPLEMVKLLIVQAAAENDARCQNKGGKRSPKKLMFLDIGKAHLQGRMQREAYVELPPERHEEGKCAKLIFTLYGMREAAANWEQEYSRTMRELGFVQGIASSVTFYHPQKGLRVVVHGDDFIMSGEDQDLWWVHNELARRYPVKMRGVIGPEKGDAKEVVVLNRVLTWENDTFKYEADPRHVELMLKHMGMEDCKPVATPGVKDAVEDEREIDRERHGIYRSVVARANFLAQDRADVRFAVKELCRWMSAPREQDWAALKRLCRYLKGRPRVVQYVVVDRANEQAQQGELDVFVGKELPPDLDVVVDSDWAGCRRTRRSTSGGCVLFRGACLKFWSTTQQHIALSSGEAEYYAAVRSGSEGLYLQNLCSDLGIPCRVVIHTDSAACQGICSRDGVGKMRHVELQYFWLQQAIRAGKLSMRRVPGKANPADLMTKFLGSDDCQQKMAKMGMFFEEGRSEAIDAA